MICGGNDAEAGTQERGPQLEERLERAEAGRVTCEQSRRTQGDAVRRAREILKESGGGEVTIHGRDGRIRDSDTVKPGRDPFPPRDRK